LTELPAVLAAQAPDVRFDRMIGRNALMNPIKQQLQNSWLN